MTAVKEVLHLEQLHDASGGLLPKPYASGTLHISPIMLLLARPWHRALAASPELLHVASALLWSVVDVLTGLLLAGAFTRKRTLAKSTTWTAYRTASSRGPSEYIDSIVYAGAMFASPGGVAACYLFNPLTIASCLARSTGPFNALAVILAADAGLAGGSYSHEQVSTPFRDAILLSCSFHSIPTCAGNSTGYRNTALAIPTAPISSSGFAMCNCKRRNWSKTKERESKRESLRCPIELNRIVNPTLRRIRLLLPTQTWSRTTAVLSVLFFAAALAGGVYASFLVAGRDWSFLKRAYGTM